MTKLADGEKTAIGPWLLIPVLIIASIGHGMLNMPHFIAKVMGNNCYWAFPIAACLFVVPAVSAIYLLAKRFPGQSLIEQGKSILGPFLGTITGFGYLGFLLFFLAILTRDVVNLASEYFLFQTPVIWLALTYLLTAAYIASRGIETITRTASLMVLPALFMLLFFSVPSFQNVSLTLLKPVFTTNPLVYLQGAKAALQNFYMLGIVAMVLPYLKPLQSFPRFAGGTILLLLILFLLIVIPIIGAVGPEFIVRFNYPSLGFFRTISIPGLMLEQVSIFIGISWLVTVLMGTGFGHYAVSLGFSQLIPFWNYKVFVWILVPLKLIIIMLPAGILQTKILVDFIAQTGWIPFFGYPFLLWMIALLLNKRGTNENAV